MNQELIMVSGQNDLIGMHVTNNTYSYNNTTKTLLLVPMVIY